MSGECCYIIFWYYYLKGLEYVYMRGWTIRQVRLYFFFSLEVFTFWRTKTYILIGQNRDGFLFTCLAVCISSFTRGNLITLFSSVVQTNAFILPIIALFYYYYAAPVLDEQFSLPEISFNCFSRTRINKIMATNWLILSSAILCVQFWCYCCGKKNNNFARNKTLVNDTFFS